MADRLPLIDLNPRFERLRVGAVGPVYSIARKLGNSSKIGLVIGSHGNLSLSGLSIIAASPFGASAAQTAIVREEGDEGAIEYRVTLTTLAVLGDGSAPANAIVNAAGTGFLINSSGGYVLNRPA